VEDSDSETRASGEGALRQAIGRQIREFRTALGMTVAELGETREIDGVALFGVESGGVFFAMAPASAIGLER